MKKKWSQTPHERWQIDGKEQIELGDGSRVSWMNVADEGTGAHLGIFVDEHRTVSGMDPSEATRYINKSFERWGLPKEIKVDNGHPFVNTRGRESPTKTILWWIGLGIDVIQNPPGCPQENGIVECLQGTMKQWSNPKVQMDLESFQKRLDEESDFQRNHYRIPSRNYKTRIELYPGLETNSRIYNPMNFSMRLVDGYLAKKVFHRSILKGGKVKFFGEYEYIGTRYRGLNVTITFDTDSRLWYIRKEDGALLKTTRKGVPFKNDIMNFALGKME